MGESPIDFVMSARITLKKNTFRMTAVCTVSFISPCASSCNISTARHPSITRKRRVHSR